MDDTRRVLESVVQALVPGETLDEISVSSEEEARRFGLLGSPSIRFDGEDLEGEVHRNLATGCRGYDGEDTPPRWLIEAGLLRALSPKGFLFLCVANSARSQMGEGVARMLAPQTVRVQSAGSRPTSVRPEAARVLAELDIDTSSQFSKNVTDIDPETVDTVITLCAEEECPIFLGKAHRLHWGLPDPAAVEGNEETRLNAFRHARDELVTRLRIVFSNTRVRK